jgi:hypothetical protein
MSDRLLVVSTTAFCLVYDSYLGEVLIQSTMPYPSLDKYSRLIRGERPIQMRVLPQQGLIHFSCVLARQSRGVERGRILTPVPL